MARLKARRSRYRFTHRLAGSAPAVVVAAILLVALVGGGVATARVVAFLNHVSGGGVSLNTITNAAGITEPPVGSIAYRLKHKDPTPINVLVLGYGGAENDAPYLTDTLMAVRLDPTSGRVAMISVPRDTYVSIDAWPDSAHIVDREKINAAFEFGTDESQAVQNSQKLPQYRGRDGGGHLAEEAVGKVTGLKFDRYAAIDFKAFREVVNALGGIEVCLDTPLDDNQYPAYGGGYVAGGIHFPAGCQHVNGENALRLARSREAIEPQQNTDFGRARRQQQIIAAIKKQALSADGLTKGLGLMSALNDNFKTDLTVDDMTAIYQWSKTVSDTQTLHYALSDSNFLSAGGCGPPSAGYILCPDDPSYGVIHDFVARTFPPTVVSTSHAPVAVAWGGSPSDLGSSITEGLRPFGFTMGSAIRAARVPQATVIYDFSGGQYPDTASWLAQFFGAQVVTPNTSTPAPIGLDSNQGFVVYVGHDYARHWYNCAAGVC